MPMITMADGFVLYTLVSLLAVSALGVYEWWRSRVRGWSVAEEQLGACSGCGLTFLVKRHEVIVRCPRCRSLCPARRK